MHRVVTAAGDGTAELVEVEYAGTWHPAELRRWTAGPDGTRWAAVALRRGVGTFLDTVPAARVRSRRV